MTTDGLEELGVCECLDYGVDRLTHSNAHVWLSLQELAVPVVHDGGALLAFVCGVMYTLLQSIISYKSCPQWNSLSTCHVRMAISAVSCAAVVPSILSTFVGVLAGLTPSSTLPPAKKKKKKAWEKQRLTVKFPYVSEEPLGEKCKSLRKMSHQGQVRSKESSGKRMLWKEGGKNVRKLQSLFTFLPTGSASPAMGKYLFFFGVLG